MIELVSATRCIHCQACVKACPENVFDEVRNAAPVIARPDDCQTCFLCELYCPADALYVSPLCDQHETVDESELQRSGLLGSFSRVMGWTGAHPRGTADDTTYLMFEDRRVKP